MKKTIALLLTAVLLLPASSFAYVRDLYHKPGQKTPYQKNKEWHTNALSVFHTCAFSAEYGDRGRNCLIRWDTPIRICAAGNPSRQDLQTLDGFIDELKQRVRYLPAISRVSSRSSANIVIHFCRLSEMASLIPGYVRGNWGYFSYQCSNYRIYQAAIGIATDKTTQKQRNHLMKEELVGALGLTNDHDSDSSSILYQGWTEVQNLSRLDWQMLDYLYHPYVRPGDTWAAVESELKSYYINVMFN